MMNKPKTKRLFVAIHVHPDQPLITLLDRLKKHLHYSRINWIDPHNMHLTLKFLGETAVDKVPEIYQLLAGVADRHRQFSYPLDKVGVFGSRYDPRVIWLGADKHPDVMTRMGNDVLDAFERIGFPHDRQNFVPHLTLGRIKHLHDKQLFQHTIQDVQRQEYQKLEIRDLKLFESQLKPAGPVYSTIHSVNLLL